MAQSISYLTAIVVLFMALMSLTCDSRLILQSEEVTPMDISKGGGSRKAEIPGSATTWEESEREVPTGPDPIHHRGNPKNKLAYLPKKLGPTYNTQKNPAAQFP